jgi:hypothetical protein
MQKRERFKIVTFTALSIISNSQPIELLLKNVSNVFEVPEFGPNTKISTYFLISLTCFRNPLAIY